VSPTACLACVWYRPCHVASWKIRAHPDGRSRWQCHRGIFVYYNSPHPVDLHGTHGGSRATLSQEVGARAIGHVTALELPCARRRELAPWDAWQHPSCLEPGLGSWGHGSRADTQATLIQEAGAGATRGVAAPELPMSGGITRCHGHVGACERKSCPSS
jgi:ribosomal protein L35AE/L33A